MLILIATSYTMKRSYYFYLLKEVLKCGEHFRMISIKIIVFLKFFEKLNKLLFSGKCNFEETSFSPQ